MTRLEIVPATRELIERYYGNADARPTLRAFVGLLDGEPIGVGGIAYHGPVIEVFSDLKPEMKQYRFTLYRTARRVMAMIDGRYALAAPDADEPGACAFLERLGFELHPGGEFYEWRR